MNRQHHKRKFQEIEEKFAEDQGLPFQEALPETEIREVINELNISYRRRILTPFIVIWAMLSRVFRGDCCCKKEVKNIVAFFEIKGWAVKLTVSAYCQACKRLPQKIFSILALSVAKKQENSLAPEHLWHGRRVKIVDGSSFNMADTPANQRAYPQSSSQKAGCGFPIARILVLFSLATGMILEMHLAPMSWSEHRMFMMLLRHLDRGDIILGDRGFSSYFLIATILAHEIDSVFRMNASRKVDFAAGRIIGIDDHVVLWKKPASRSALATPEEWALLPETLELREVRYRVEVSGFRPHEIVLVTTLLDFQTYTVEDLADLYRLRWNAELYLRDVKITMHMEFINSRTPKMVKNRVWAHVLAYNLVRRLMWQAGVEYRVSPLRISFKGTLDTIDVYFPRLATANAQIRRQTYENFLLAIAQDQLPDRRNRYEPRVIKRRKKPKYNFLFFKRSLYRQQVGL